MCSVAVTRRRSRRRSRGAPLRQPFAAWGRPVTPTTERFTPERVPRLPATSKHCCFSQLSDPACIRLFVFEPGGAVRQRLGRPVTPDAGGAVGGARRLRAPAQPADVARLPADDRGPSPLPLSSSFASPRGVQRLPQAPWQCLRHRHAGPSGAGGGPLSEAAGCRVPVQRCGAAK